MKLNSVKPNPGAIKAKKRVGRGPGSGTSRPPTTSSKPSEKKSEPRTRPAGCRANLFRFFFTFRFAIRKYHAPNLFLVFLRFYT